MKHTPGPWQRDKYGNLNDSNGKSVLFRSISTVNGGGDHRIKEAEANTNLISVAPELLEALKNLELSANSLQYCFDRRPENFGVALTQLTADAKIARDAIQKATAG